MARTITLTADEWELFTLTMDCTAAADALNAALAVAMTLPTRREAYEYWLAEAEAWDRYGAADTEPRSVAWSVLAATPWRNP